MNKPIAGIPKSCVSITMPSSESASDSPATAKRPKLEPPADDDEDISIIEERIHVGQNKTQTQAFLPNGIG